MCLNYLTGLVPILFQKATLHMMFARANLHLEF